MHGYANRLPVVARPLVGIPLSVTHKGIRTDKMAHCQDRTHKDITTPILGDLRKSQYAPVRAARGCLDKLGMTR